MHRTRWLVVAALTAAAPMLVSAQTAPAPVPAQPSEAQPQPPAPPPPPPQGKVTATPYGFLLLQTFFNDGPFSVKDYPGQVLQNGDGGAFLLSARGTRFGLKIGLPDDPFTGARLSGVIEADFKGGYPQQAASTTTCTQAPAGGAITCATATAVPGTSWYNALFRIRLGYLTATWGTAASKLTLVLGQDWRIVAPLAPTSIAFGYDQLFTQAGNLNTRDPQLKLVYDAAFGAVGLNVSAAAVGPQDTFTGAPTGGVDYDAGNRARMPNGEARAALSVRSGSTKVAEVGVAGGIGKRRYDNAATPNVTVDTTTRVGAIDAVLNIPFLTLQGEGYMSDGMEDSYTGLVTNAVLLGSTGNRLTSITNLQSRGFWAQAVLKPHKLVQLTGGYGVAQLRGAGLPASAISGTTRTRNSQVAAGLLLNVANPWKFGFEWVHTISSYDTNTNRTLRSIAADAFVIASKAEF